MAYITRDPRVQKILRETPNIAMARQKIRALPPQEKAHCAYLDWEIDEAMAEHRLAPPS